MSDFLFAQPSLLSGVGRCLDIGGIYDAYNTSRSGNEADTKAMRADVLAVASDLRSAISTVKAEQAAAERD